MRTWTFRKCRDSYSLYSLLCYSALSYVGLYTRSRPLARPTQVPTTTHHHPPSFDSLSTHSVTVTDTTFGDEAPELHQRASTTSTSAATTTTTTTTATITATTATANTATTSTSTCLATRRHH